MYVTNFKLLTSTKTDAIKFDNRYGANELVEELNNQNGLFKTELELTSTPQQDNKLLQGLSYLVKTNDTIVYHLDFGLLMQLMKRIDTSIFDEQLDMQFRQNLVILSATLKKVLHSSVSATIVVEKTKVHELPVSIGKI